ncbi:hypothetical protein AIOL_002069 [Candidatus Rhodobacter oscarellae]|uniref:Uncharacterized protein n=1 Tax=Candidatus Rhodobacter oscarellae TaxID=1675527 RepID=A0A0J9E312_9RHOB|nr:hypothetical protein [Candidatus Rhodobacter lobularis]KMW57110.1 hypothetical protein AIOL_002069 [Candidatus Rhodobacter lobularis]
MDKTQEDALIDQVAWPPLSAAPFIERAPRDNGVENAVARFHARYSSYSSFRHIGSNAISRADTKLLWIEGPPERYEGCRYFGQNPTEMVAWYDAHM